MDPSEIADAFHFALQSNNAWASYKGHQNPSFFEKAAAGQSPQILWLGCSDSRVPETTVMGLQPGEVFVHRNIANIISPSDINSMAVIEYAVIHLKVKHVVLCGHTCCGGAGAALSDNRVGGVIDAWISPLKAIRRSNQAELDALKDDKQKAVRLAELNVEMGVHHLMSNHVIEDAIKDRGLQVHGTIYDVACGKMKDLNVGTDMKLKAAMPDSAAKKVISTRPRRGGIDGAEDEETAAAPLEVVSGNHGMLEFNEEGAVLTVA